MRMQHRLEGFGQSVVQRLWGKATSVSISQLVVEEILRQEEAARRVVSQAKRGQWMMESIEQQKHSWREV